MTDEYDVLKTQEEWKKAKQAAEDDPADTMASTLMIMKRAGKELKIMVKKISDVDDKLEKHVKTDDRRHDTVVGMLAEHIGQPANLAHPNTEECTDGKHCGEEEDTRHPVIKILTNDVVVKALAVALSIVVLGLFGVASTGGA